MIRNSLQRLNGYMGHVGQSHGMLGQTRAKAKGSGQAAWASQLNAFQVQGMSRLYHVLPCHTMFYHCLPLLHHCYTMLYIGAYLFQCFFLTFVFLLWLLVAFGSFLVAFGFWWRGQVQLCCFADVNPSNRLYLFSFADFSLMSISLYVSLSYMHYLASSFLPASPNAMGGGAAPSPQPPSSFFDIIISRNTSIHPSIIQSINLSMCLFVCLSVVHAMFSFLSFPSLSNNM